MHAHRSLVILLAGLGLAAGPLAAAAQALDTWPPSSSRTTFINGGFGEDEVDAIRQRAHEFPLRVVFADGPRNEYQANVPVVIADARGVPVFTLRDAGPLLYVMLPEGRYSVTAEVDGIRKTQQVTLDRGRGRDVVFHWNTEPRWEDMVYGTR